MNILVIGTGYVGTTTGLIFCEMGHRVTGLDMDNHKIKELQGGRLYFYEPGLEELLIKHNQAGNIIFTTETEKAIKENDVIFICVGTPMGEDGNADLNYVKNVSEDIGCYMDKYKVIVTKSTVPVGTAEKVSNWIKKSQKEPFPFDVVSNPEFLREGSAVTDALNPDRIVIGTTSHKSRNIMRELYKNFNCPVVVTNPKASEMIKYAANSFLALKISFINELSRLCDVLGINVKDISTGIGLDHRIGSHFLHAGMGYGGSCFPKDVNALIHTAREQGQPLSILENVKKVNEDQHVFFLEKIKQAFGGTLENKTLAILGLSFKANTDDTRESPSLLLINKLIKEKAIVKTHDPVAKTDLYPQFSSVLETVEGSDAIILCTDWKEYREMDWSALKAVMENPYIFDGRNMLAKDQVEGLGFQYFGIAI